MNRIRVHTLAATLLALALPQAGCAGSSSGSNGDGDGLPTRVEMRAVDGEVGALPAAPPGLSAESSRCPSGAVIKRVYVYRAPGSGPIVGLAIGCSVLELVEEDAVLRIEFEPIEDLAPLGNRGIAGGSVTSLFCPHESVVTHIATRVTTDVTRRLSRIEVECTPLFLTGAGTGIEPTLGTPTGVLTAGSPGGFETDSLSCLDPDVDTRGALATGIHAYESATEIGAVVPRCRRPVIDF